MKASNPNCSCQQSFYSAKKKKNHKHFVAAQSISPQQYVLSCVFRPQAGSSMTGKDKVIMWSLPAWPTPPLLLSSTMSAPLPTMPCNACFFQTSFPGLYSIATSYFTGRVCLLHQPGSSRLYMFREILRQRCPCPFLCTSLLPSDWRPSKGKAFVSSISRHSLSPPPNCASFKEELL